VVNFTHTHTHTHTHTNTLSSCFLTTHFIIFHLRPGFKKWSSLFKLSSQNARIRESTVLNRQANIPVYLIPSYEGTNFMNEDQRNMMRFNKGSARLAVNGTAVPS